MQSPRPKSINNMDEEDVHNISKYKTWVDYIKNKLNEIK